jgi:universal stress protein A
MGPKKILFCTDFSENSEPARQLAIDYAKALGASLVVIHVIDSAIFETYKEWVIGEAVNQVVAGAQATANKKLEQMSTECSGVVKEITTFCKIGVPAREIVSLAGETSSDLIVMGTHGRSGIKDLVMGSVARSVLKTAHRPVLIVEAPSS